MPQPLPADRPERMSVDEYQTIVCMLYSWARMLEQIDLPSLERYMINAIDWGCFLNPTGWIQKHKVLEQDLELVQAFKPARNIGLRLTTAQGKSPA